jgi:hypothetical protein
MELVSRWLTAIRTGSLAQPVAGPVLRVYQLWLRCWRWCFQQLARIPTLRKRTLLAAWAASTILFFYFHRTKTPFAILLVLYHVTRVATRRLAARLGVKSAQQSVYNRWTPRMCHLCLCQGWLCCCKWLG